MKSAVISPNPFASPPGTAPTTGKVVGEARFNRGDLCPLGEFCFPRRPAHPGKTYFKMFLLREFQH